MTFSKTIKDITFIPFVIKDTWTTIRDLSINQFRANQHVAKSIKEIFDSVEKFTKNQNDFNATMTKKLAYIEATSISLGKWHDWQEKFNTSLLETIISEKKLTALLRDNFDSIDVNINEQDIQCNGQEEMQNLATSLDDLSLQIQESNSKINETYLTVVVLTEMIKDLQKILKPKNVEENIDVV